MADELESYLIEELKTTKAELKKYKEKELEDKEIKTLYTLRIDTSIHTKEFEFIQTLEKIRDDLTDIVINEGAYFDTGALLADLASVGFEIYTLPYLQTIYFVNVTYGLAFEGSCLHLVVIDDRYISKQLFHILNYVLNYVTNYIEENKVR